MISAKKKKHRLIVTIIAGILAFIVILTVILLMRYDRADETNAENVEAESDYDNVHTEQEKETVGTTLSGDVDTLGQDVEPVRQYYIDYIDLAVLHSGEELYDIHIRFPNGEDYIVVAGKQITSMTEEAFCVRLTQRELHMLSSARTDAEIYTGTQLYLSGYGRDDGNSEPDYPWNQYVLGAHGISEPEAEEIYAKRIQLEENLVAFMNQTLKK